MPTTLDTETQKKLDERNKLLAKQHQHKLTELELKTLNEIFNELKDLGINQTFRDPIYQKFLIAVSEHEEFKPKEKYTEQELKKQNALAISILDEIIKEKK